MQTLRTARLDVRQRWKLLPVRPLQLGAVGQRPQRPRLRQGCSPARTPGRGSAIRRQGLERRQPPIPDSARPAVSWSFRLTKSRDRLPLPSSVGQDGALLCLVLTRPRSPPRAFLPRVQRASRWARSERHRRGAFQRQATGGPKRHRPKLGTPSRQPGSAYLEEGLGAWRKSPDAERAGWRHRVLGRPRRTGAAMAERGRRVSREPADASCTI